MLMRDYLVIRKRGGAWWWAAQRYATWEHAVRDALAWAKVRMGGTQ